MEELKRFKMPVFPLIPSTLKYILMYLPENQISGTYTRHYHVY